MSNLVLSDFEQRDALLREADRRRFLYASLETLLVHNRLTIVARPKWCEPSFGYVFTTLTTEERHHLQVRVLSSDNMDYARWSLAYHTWMVNGVEFPTIEDRVWLYHNFYRDLNRHFCRVLRSYVYSLDTQVTRAVRSLESFCYEYYSRHLWATLKPQLVGAGDHHPIRNMWRSFNETEDYRINQDGIWIHTRTQISAHTSKGAKALEKANRDYHSKEENRRNGVIERFVNFVIQGPEEERQPLTLTIDGKEVVVPRVQSASTIQEMEDEMKRHLAGEKDLHDLAMDQYFDRIRKARDQKKKEAQTRREAASQASGVVGQKATLQGYTPEQLKALGKDRPTGAKPVATGTSPERQYLFDRYLDRDTDAVAEIGVRGIPEVRSRGRGSSEGPSLQEKIENRRLNIPHKE